MASSRTTAQDASETCSTCCLPAGSVAFLWYAERLFEFPLGVFAVALSTAALPSFATLAKRDLAAFRDTVAFALRVVNLIALPAAIGLALTAEPLTSVLFIRGQFTGADRTARLIAGAKRDGSVSVYSSTAVEDFSTRLRMVFSK